MKSLIVRANPDGVHRFLAFDKHGTQPLASGTEWNLGS
jgi:hypothetical protein